MIPSLKTIALALTATLASAQVAPAELQTAGFNSSFALLSAQIEAASLSDSTVASLNNVVRYDQSQLANGGPAEDDFYTLPLLENTTQPLKAGTLLKVQSFTDTTNYTLPPNTALSRIIYTSTNLNGTVLPASAFIFWPFQPPRRPQRPSSSGRTAHPAFFASNAPSAHRALWYGDAAPFALTLDGYAVVAPDYAGLGISTSWDGSPIPHQYLASPTSAHDALSALRAARKAFQDLLSDDYVVMGHSQGGGVAWGVAEVLEAEADTFADLTPGYPGIIAGSPTTDVLSGMAQFIVPWVGMILQGIFPDFDIAKWLTPLGIARVELLREIEGGISASQQLFLTGEEVVKASYNETWYVDAYARLANAGRKPFRSPMLVLQGTADGYRSGVRRRGGTGHVPTLDATRPVWMQWIRDRFEGKAVAQTGCVTTHLESFLPIGQYQATGNAFLQWAGATEYGFETPLGP
ncbi:Uu.00g011650.m01.CDS01 [Anthostomella pinea]|uniref:Uu.00g011650.m01.CDS01 n=1 Tax=Anthostomella pinea TaxID=933095 RepID=A0AAI8VS14_9PEZI|nr:Uu.00g011650.m01.CDS01 [Anthostomella pinea]